MKKRWYPQESEQIVVGLLVRRTDGIGLSAPQVGINVQLMVFNPVGERGEGEEIVLVNPRVSRYSKKLVLYNEGCLSFPGIHADVQVLIHTGPFTILIPSPFQLVVHPKFMNFILCLFAF